jgi:hypothetical protein
MHSLSHFAQFALITKIRNDILHYGAQFETLDVLLASNERDAHTPARLREIRITPYDLWSMNHDLHTSANAAYWPHWKRSFRARMVTDGRNARASHVKPPERSNGLDVRSAR